MPNSRQVCVFFLFFLCILFSGQASSGQLGETSPEKIIIQLRWKHQFQFAGYYAAKKMGYYAEEGLDVSFRERHPRENYVQAVLDGKAQYGVADSGLLLFRFRGQPVVLLAQIFQHSPLIFLSRKDSGINSPYEMKGKKVMFDAGGLNAPLSEMLSATLGRGNDFIQIPHSMDYSDLINGKVDVISAYLTDQPYQLRKQGAELNIIDPRNYGIDFYGDNFFTSEQEINAHPGRAERVVRASLRGWAYALEHQEEIIDYILKNYAPRLDRDFLRYEARMTAIMVLHDLIPLGDINPRRYDRIAETYANLKLIDQKKVADGFIFNVKKQLLHSPPPTVSLSASEQQWLSHHPDIVLGTLIFPPGVIKNADGTLSGFVIEFHDLLNKRLGTNIKLQLQEGPIAKLSQKMQSRQFDGVIPVVAQTREYAPLFDFSDPIMTTDVYVYTRTGEEFEMASLADLSGRKVGIQDGVAHLKELLEQHPAISPITFTTPGELLDALLTSKVDAILGNVNIQYLAAEAAIQIKLAYALKGERQQVTYGIRKDWPELITIINKGLAGITTAERELILSKWLVQKAPSEEQAKVFLTAEEKKWLKAHPVIKVATDPSWAPMEFLDQDGHYKGIAIDYLNSIADKLGIRFETVKTQAWSQLLTKGKQRTVDMFSCAAPTQERSKFLTFSSPYITTPVAIFGNMDASYVGNIDLLHGKRVAVVKGYAIHEIMAKEHPEVTLIPVANIHEALDMLESGSVFAYVESLIATSHLITQGGHALVKVVGETPYELALGMASRSDWPIFADILQKALDSISEKERNTIYQKWISVRYEHGFNYSLIWKIVGGAVFVITVFIFWNRRLKIEVAKQTSALRLREQQYRLLADNAADVIWTMDTAQKVTYISPSIKELRGYSVEEAISQSVEEKFTSSSLEVAYTAFCKAPEQNTPIVFEVEQPCKDGSTVWVEMSVRVLLDDSGQRIGLIGTSRNITERKRSEEEKKGLEKQLQQTQKMESIGTLAGGIAHDFNNILSAIFGYAELAMMQQDPKSQTFENLNEVLQAAVRAKDLVKQILLFSRQGEQERQPLQPHLIVKEALKLLRASIPTTIAIKEDIQTDCGTILADPTQIHQIIMNLCTNAYHAMREKGGVLTVRLSIIEIRTADINFNALDLDPGNYIKLEVADTGRGIDQATMDKIFNPYFTTKPKGEGTGLGLSVVHGIVKSYGGIIKVYSEPEQGTTFHVYFPKVENKADLLEHQQENALPTGTEHILIVDDEEPILDTMRKTLESLGYTITAHLSSLGALEAFNAAPDSFQLMITDMTMPHMTGLELIQKVFALRPNMPTILCTGFSELISEEKARALGIRKFLVKPILRTGMAKTVREVLNSVPKAT